MKILRWLLVLATLLGLTGLLAAALPVPHASGPSEAPPAASVEATTVTPSLDSVYRDAARALRQRDCDAAAAGLGPRSAAEHPESSFARVVLGLYAHSCEDLDRARELLFLGGGRGTPLEDWRLLVLADVAAAQDQRSVAEAALEKILREHPSSPLRWEALETAARVAWSSKDADRTLAVLERSRHEPLSGPAASAARLRLETLAWEVGTALERPAVRRRAARELLTRAPSHAEELGVLDAFPEVSDTDEVPWGHLLSPDQLVERARSLLDDRRPEAAAEALTAIPESKRTFEALRLTAEALTRARRGTEALELLAGLDPVEPRQRAELTWARAQATQDMAAAYRGRQNLPSAERRALRERYRELLLETVRRAEPPLVGRALRALFGERVDEDRFEDALKILITLKHLDRRDDTGADWLWNLGWQAYQSRDPSRAIGYWAELATLYPEDRHTRAGRYWSARAYETLGETERAHRLYQRVAAVDTTDFYRRYALARLGEAPETASPAAVEPWPTDPLLGRVRLLSELGLEGLAQTELDALWHRADPRAAAALQSLILARGGQPRSSIGHIRRAFPALGTPEQASVPEQALELYYPLAFLDDVRQSAETAGLPLPLVLGMIRQESGFDRHATSRAGALGLMQLMPATGREVAQRIGLPFSPRRLAEPSFNTRLGTTYFRQVLAMFGGDVELALAGYNGGPYRIKRLWRRAGRRDEDSFLEGLPVSESKIYVKRIILLSDSYERLYALGS